MPGPTVKVRMKENGQGSIRQGAACLVIALGDVSL
jgi:hypothetical protein